MQQHGIGLVGKLALCSGRSQAKGIRAATPQHTTARARMPNVGPYLESLGDSRYVVMLVDSASRLRRSYGTREQSPPTIHAVVKRFVADMGVARKFRKDNGSEHTNRTFAEYGDGLGIRRELTAPYTSQQNGAVESALARTMKDGLTA